LGREEDAVLNWADLSSLLVIVCGIGGGLVVPDPKAGAVTKILCGVGGFIVGFGVAMLSNRCAYLILFSKKLPLRLLLILYMVVPMLFFFVAAFGASCVVGAVFWSVERLF
jgi:hypothetical protein